MCKLREKLPEWVNEKHNLVLSNDIDSLASCAVMKANTGSEIKFFYDFENLYKAEQMEDLKRCWIDIAVSREHSFDNHVSKISHWEKWNENMVNLNCYVTNNENYTHKYAGSTLLTIMSAYNMPLPSTEEGKMLLLAVDSAYWGFYDRRYNKTQRNYLENVLEYPELYEVMGRHYDGEIEEVGNKYNVKKGLISFENGKLKTNLDLKAISELLELDLELPVDNFYSYKQFEVINTVLNPMTKFVLEDIDEEIVTFAVLWHNKARYSKLIS